MGSQHVCARALGGWEWLLAGGSRIEVAALRGVAGSVCVSFARPDALRGTLVATLRKVGHSHSFPPPALPET
jgi:hypothetical protein